MEPSVIVKKSKISGKGIFANRDFKKGEVVLRWKPKPLTKCGLERLPDTEKHYIISSNDKIFLMQEPERYVNHSCEANTSPGTDRDVAVRDIKKGEEITSDYSKEKGLKSFICHCGSKQCRGKITSLKK